MVSQTQGMYKIWLKRRRNKRQAKWTLRIFESSCHCFTCLTTQRLRHHIKGLVWGQLRDWTGMDFRGTTRPKKKLPGSQYFTASLQSNLNMALAHEYAFWLVGAILLICASWIPELNWKGLMSNLSWKVKYAFTSSRYHAVECRY